MNDSKNEKAMKKVTRFTRTVYSTLEFIELQRAAKQAGARIIRTDSLRNGLGISVTLEMDGDRRQF